MVSPLKSQSSPFLFPASLGSASSTETLALWPSIRKQAMIVCADELRPKVCCSPQRGPITAWAYIWGNQGGSFCFPATLVQQQREVIWYHLGQWSDMISGWVPTFNTASIPHQLCHPVQNDSHRPHSIPHQSSSYCSKPSSRGFKPEFPFAFQWHGLGSRA